MRKVAILAVCGFLRGCAGNETHLNPLTKGGQHLCLYLSFHFEHYFPRLKKFKLSAHLDTLGSVDISTGPDKRGDKTQKSEITGSQLLETREDTTIPFYLVDKIFN